MVDDAIVMLENIVRHVEQGEKPYEAALKGSREIGFTILSMTVSLAAVFIPIVFMGGIVGRLLHEFAVTIILAIVFSGVVSVTLTPMLCGRMLKDEHGAEAQCVLSLERAHLQPHAGRLRRTLRWSLAHRRDLGLFLRQPGGHGRTVRDHAAGFPAQRRHRPAAGQHAGRRTAPPSTRWCAIPEQVAQIVSADPNVEGVLAQMDGRERRRRHQQCPADDDHAQAAERAQVGPPIRSSRELRPKVSPHSGHQCVSAESARPSGIGGRMAALATISTRCRAWIWRVAGLCRPADGRDAQDARLRRRHQRPRRATPAVKVTIDRDRAAALGVTPQQIENALGSAFGGQQISQIYASSDQYQVILELLPQYQRDATALRRLYVTGADGTLVPLTAVTKMTPAPCRCRSIMPARFRRSRFPSIWRPARRCATRSADRQASEADRHAATIQGNFQGTARLPESTKNMGLLLLIAMIVVYIILGILYESFIHPLTILSGLPSAAVGAADALDRASTVPGRRHASACRSRSMPLSA